MNGKRYINYDLVWETFDWSQKWAPRSSVFVNRSAGYSKINQACLEVLNKTVRIDLVLKDDLDQFNSPEYALLGKLYDASFFKDGTVYFFPKKSYARVANFVVSRAKYKRKSFIISELCLDEGGTIFGIFKREKQFRLKTVIYWKKNKTYIFKEPSK